jgi:cell division protein FtsB
MLQEKAELKREHDNLHRDVSRLQEQVALLESEREASLRMDDFVEYENALWE